MPLLPRFIRKRRLRWPFWTSAVIAVGLFVVFAGSYWMTVVLSFPAPVRSLGLHSGQVAYRGYDIKGLRHEGWKLEARRTNAMPFKWWFRVDRSRQKSFVIIPLYLLGAPFVLFSTIYFLRAPLKHGEGQCSHCGYDMHGIKDEVCPECGKGSTVVPAMVTLGDHAMCKTTSKRGCPKQPRHTRGTQDDFEMRRSAPEPEQQHLQIVKIDQPVGIEVARRARAAKVEQQHLQVVEVDIEIAIGIARLR